MARRRGISPVHPFSAVMATAGVVLLAALVFDIGGRLNGAPGEAPEPSQPASEPSRHFWESTFSRRVEAVTERLEHGPLPLPTPTILPHASPLQYRLRQYEFSIPAGSTDKVRAALEAARGDDPSVTFALLDQPDGLRGEIGIDGLRTHTMIVHWEKPANEATARAPTEPRVAVVIDDLGNNLLLARRLLSIDVPLTFAVMPFRPFSKEVAELAHLSGRGVLLHLPMEAEGGEDNGEQVLLRVDENRAQIQQQLQQTLDSVPYLVGVNNHMGSRFTRDAERMSWVLEELKKRNLFFLDSVTGPGSVAREAAQKIGLPFIARDVFLEDPSGQATVEQQIERLLALAQKQGQAVAIGHPRDPTIEALRALPGLAEAQRVKVVPLADLVQPQSP